MTEVPRELDITDKIDYDEQFEKSFVEPLKVITQKIDFIDIYKVIQRTFNHFSCSNVSTLQDIFEYDKQARIQAEKVIKSLH